MLTNWKYDLHHLALLHFEKRRKVEDTFHASQGVKSLFCTGNQCNRRGSTFWAGWCLFTQTHTNDCFQSEPQWSSRSEHLPDLTHTSCARSTAPSTTGPQPARSSPIAPLGTTALTCQIRLHAVCSYFLLSWKQANVRKADLREMPLSSTKAWWIDQNKFLWMIWVWNPWQEAHCQPLLSSLISSFPWSRYFICTVNSARAVGSTEMVVGTSTNGGDLLFHCPF